MGEDLKKRLVGTHVGKFKLIRYIDRGASALVFESENTAGEKIAVKVFDPEFIKQHGDDKQVERIKRQLLLKGKHHPNLVDILDGGHCSKSGYHFIVMPFLPAPSLDKVIDKIPREKIRSLISQVAAAAKFLESLDIYHRDIKPANIAIEGADYSRAILLDLGVMRPLGVAGLTDTTDKKIFVGTTQYSPPEFLLRDEVETADGYRAVTFYQLGAVLHDLLMRQQLFQDKKINYGKLVRAVLIEEPIINCTDCPPDLVRLSRFCLLKDPSKRLQLVNWSSFSSTLIDDDSIGSLKKRITKLRAAAPDGHSPASPTSQLRHLTKQTATMLCQSLKTACIDEGAIFPPVAYKLFHSKDGEGVTFLLTFSPSAKHKLDLHLLCVFQLKVTQATPRLIEIQFAAGVSEKSGSDLVSSKIPFNAIGHEISDGDGQDLCLKKLYQSLAGALEERISGPTSHTSDEVTWFLDEGV